MDRAARDTMVRKHRPWSPGQGSGDQKGGTCSVFSEKFELNETYYFTKQALGIHSHYTRHIHEDTLTKL